MPDDLLNKDAVSGHNRPPIAKPASPEDIQADLADRHKNLIDREAELMASFAELPNKIEDEVTSGKAQELYKMMRVFQKTAEETGKIEAEPYKGAAKAVTGWFDKRVERIDTDSKTKRGAKYVILDRVEAYVKARAEAERIKKEEEARKAQEERDRLLREAAEAEERKRQAEAKRLEEERKAREAQEAKERAEREAREAQERAEKAKEEARLAELQRKEREAREAREAAEREAARKKQKEIDEAEAERRRQEDEKRAAEKAEADRIHAEHMAKLKKEREEAEAQRLEARRKAEEELQKRREAEAAAKEHKTTEAEAAKDEKLNMRGAERSERVAEKNTALAGASTGDLGRNRSDLSTIGTVARVWKCDVLDYDKVPLEKLRPFLNRDAIDAAVWKYMQAGLRDLPGVRFYQEEDARII
ncbi:MAG: hypothetical protein E6Q97_18755 [Desulfurellales bacterium]|nr:MAG: hypothetical protein E6Q97_18755 [Desulfurellales bacterium]